MATIFELPNETLYNIALYMRIDAVVEFMRTCKTAFELYTNVFGLINAPNALRKIRTEVCKKCLRIGPDVSYGYCIYCYKFCNSCGSIGKNKYFITETLYTSKGKTIIYECKGGCRLRCISCQRIFVTNIGLWLNKNDYVVCVTCNLERISESQIYLEKHHNIVTKDSLKKHFQLVYMSNRDISINTYNNTDRKIIKAINIIDGHKIPIYE
jgi:hypothetical protein